jgi:crossover junction endodeoxyribonuclease RuvC
MQQMITKRIIGLDPGLRLCGFGVIDVAGNQFRWLDHGVIKVPTDQPIEKRLAFLFSNLQEVVQKFQPTEASLEKIFFNSNAQTSMLLGMARGVVALAPGLMNIPLFEYAPNLVKKSVVGVGHADKQQVQKMISIILNPQKPITADSADALAVAICHAGHSHFK